MATKSGDQGLRDWFGKSKSSDGKPGWVQLGGKYAGKPCARQPGQTSTPKCGSSKMKRNLSAKEEERARRRKNRQDPNQPEKTGGAKPTNVKTEEMNIQEVKDKPGKGSGKKDACYHKVKSRYSVWPSAYASGALVKCRKVGAANWGNKSEEFSNWREELQLVEYADGGGQIGKGSVMAGPKSAEFVEKLPGRVKGVARRLKKIVKPGFSIKGNEIQINSYEPEGEIIEDWQKVNKKDKTDGMSQKAVDAYKRENPGSKLKTAVTEKKPKGKRAKRRKSFCARSNGQRKMHNIDCSKTPDKAICKARKRWRC